MAYNDVPAFMARLRAIDGVAARCLEFAVLCAARSGEARGATWGEVDFQNAVWVVPASRMKVGKEHMVPLGDRAVTILREMEKGRTSSYVFPGFRQDRALNDATMRAVLRRLGVTDASVHGYRSSFRDWAVTRLLPRTMSSRRRWRRTRSRTRRKRHIGVAPRSKSGAH